MPQSVLVSTAQRRQDIVLLKRALLTGGSLRLVPDESYRAAHRAADSQVPAMMEVLANRWEQGSQVLREDPAVEIALVSGSHEALRDLVTPVSLVAPVTAELRLVAVRTMIASGDGILEELVAMLVPERAAGVLAKQDDELFALRFDAELPRAARIADELAAKLVTLVDETTRKSIREIIVAAFNEKFTVDAAARKIRAVLAASGVGLDAPRVRQLSHVAEQLIDQGFRGAGFTTRLEQARQVLLRRRSETIARTETLMAAARGTQEAINQAVDARLLMRERTKREWIVTPDDRLDLAICAPMDTALVGVEEPWTLPDGRRVMIPQDAHPQCRCAIGVVVES